MRPVRRGWWLSVSGSTLRRWLDQDAIRPWHHRSWIFPRDPNFAEKAGRLRDLYAREWEGNPLKDDEFVIAADEKTTGNQQPGPSNGNSLAKTRANLLTKLGNQAPHSPTNTRPHL